VVTHDVAPWTVVAGNPARVIGAREFAEGPDEGVQKQREA
jgi:acetyltransferase-like isoleucine patch superfamily enzyme